MPDIVLYPTGGGTGLVGLWKVFGELEQLGWIGSRRPRMGAVLPIGCGPVAWALEEGASRVERCHEAQVAAHRLRIPKPFARRCHLARLEGILSSFEAAAGVAAAYRLAGTGWLSPEERFVLFNMGSGLKHI